MVSLPVNNGSGRRAEQIGRFRLTRSVSTRTLTRRHDPVTSGSETDRHRLSGHEEASMHRLVHAALSVLLAALLLLPASAQAAPLAISTQFLNSRLTFGGPSFDHGGYDLDSLWLHDIEVAD